MCLVASSWGENSDNCVPEAISKPAGQDRYCFSLAWVSLFSLSFIVKFHAPQVQWQLPREGICTVRNLTTKCYCQAKEMNEITLASHRLLQESRKLDYTSTGLVWLYHSHWYELPLTKRKDAKKLTSSIFCTLTASFASVFQSKLARVWGFSYAFYQGLTSTQSQRAKPLQTVFAGKQQAHKPCDRMKRRELNRQKCISVLWRREQSNFLSPILSPRCAPRGSTRHHPRFYVFHDDLCC